MCDDVLGMLLFQYLMVMISLVSRGFDDRDVAQPWDAELLHLDGELEEVVQAV